MKTRTAPTSPVPRALCDRHAPPPARPGDQLIDGVLVRASGRPTTYRPIFGQEICYRIANGETIQAISKDMGLDPAQILVWSKEQPAFFRSIQIARELRTYGMIEQTIDIVDAPLVGSDKDQRNELVRRDQRVRVRQFFASRLLDDYRERTSGNAVQVTNIEIRWGDPDAPTNADQTARDIAASGTTDINLLVSTVADPESERAAMLRDAELIGVQVFNTDQSLAEFCGDPATSVPSEALHPEQEAGGGAASGRGGRSENGVPLRGALSAVAKSQPLSSAAYPPITAELIESAPEEELRKLTVEKMPVFELAGGTVEAVERAREERERNNPSPYRKMERELEEDLDDFCRK